MYNEKRIAHTLKQLFDNTLQGCIFARKLYPSYISVQNLVELLL